MSILCDKEIRELVLNYSLIYPFSESIKGDNKISYGLSSFGYDVRLANEFKIFRKSNNGFQTIDPKNFDPGICEEYIGDCCVIPPNGFVLGRTLEWFRMPPDIMAVCIGKSTYARCGVIVNVTPIEPGSSGHVVLEFSNTTPLPVKLYANEGACQFLFFKGNDTPSFDYLSKGGKYMYQKSVVLPKVEK